MQHYFTKEILLDELAAVNSIKQWDYPLQSKADLQPLFDRIGDARIVMLMSNEKTPMPRLVYGCSG